MAQTTLILLKTDCVEKKLCGEVLGRFESQGFTIRGIKMIEMTDAVLRDHYAHIADKAVLSGGWSNSCKRPLWSHFALEGDNVIARVRDLLGPTDSTKADPGTIRGDFGVDMMVNVCHASDSEESAQAELARFFDGSELFSY